MLCYLFKLQAIFNSFNCFFFCKLKLRGKGYYIFKSFRNTIASQFGYSHMINIYSYFLKIKFLSKTSIFLYGINKLDLFQISSGIFQLRSINIYTSRGIRFARQIIYKKIGKISSFK